MRKKILIPVAILMLSSCLFARDFKQSDAEATTSTSTKVLEKKMGPEIFEEIADIAYATIKTRATNTPYHGAIIQIHYGNSKDLLTRLERMGTGAKFLAWNKLQKRLIKNGYKLENCTTGNTFKCSVYWIY